MRQETAQRGQKIAIDPKGMRISRTSAECMRKIEIHKENAKNSTIKIEMLGEKRIQETCRLFAGCLITL